MEKYYRVLMIFVISILLAGCEQPTEPPTYIVSFEPNGGDIIEDIEVTEGTLISEPTAPKKVNYLFSGWYGDSVFNTPWNFSQNTVLGNTKLYAKWVLAEETSPPSYIDFFPFSGSILYRFSRAYSELNKRIEYEITIYTRSGYFETGDVFSIGNTSGAGQFFSYTSIGHTENILLTDSQIDNFIYTNRLGFYKRDISVSRTYNWFLSGSDSRTLNLFFQGIDVGKYSPALIEWWYY